MLIKNYQKGTLKETLLLSLSFLLFQRTVLEEKNNFSVNYVFFVISTMWRYDVGPGVHTKHGVVKPLQMSETSKALRMFMRFFQIPWEERGYRLQLLEWCIEL